MVPRAIVSAVFLAAFTLAFVSCGDDQPAPVRTVAIPSASPTPIAASVPASIVTPTQTSASTPTSAPENLTQEIPPCTPAPGSAMNPCDPDAPPLDTGMAQSVPELGEEPSGLRTMLEDGLSPPAWVTHLTLRGTYLPGTVRCTAGDPFRPPAYLQDEFGDTTYQRSIKCYIDVRVNSYVLGSGPSMLTTMLLIYSYWDDERDLVEELRQQFETAISDVFPGREHIMFLGPPVDLSSETWRSLGRWDVQLREDSTVIAVHPHRDLWRRLRPDEYQTHRAALEMELPTLTQAVTTAHQARVTEYGGRIGAETNLPMLVTDANQLRQYYTEVGAYAPGAPPPAQPPPPCGLAVPNQSDNPGLMRDCMTLLAAKDTLRGTGSLNWATGTAIASWDGVTTAGSPTRVTKVELDDEDLTGSIPAGLGSLSALTHLDLSDNSLTGDIPAELGLLHNLEEVRLSGNSLTGCIPLALRDVATHDLSSLSLPYCRPPAPGTPAAGTVGEASVPLTWTAVANTSKYRVEYREGDFGYWTLDADAITGTSHTVDGLQCEQEHQFRVSAYGSGTVYAAAWGDPSTALTATTGACTPPVFGASSYSFSVMEDAAVDDRVGSVSATDNSGEPVTYAITAGNDGDAFAIDGATGEITVAAALDHETTDEYSLTVEADDGNGQTDTVMVAISVTDVAEDAPPAPGNLGATLSSGTFTLTWDAVTGAAKYEHSTPRMRRTPRR